MEVQYPLVFFTLLLCLSAGIMAFQGGLIIAGKGTTKFHIAAVITEAVALVLGGIASFLHLHHWERIFNGFGHITSGITQELIGVVVLAIVMIITFVMIRKTKAADKPLPKWVGFVALIVGVIMGFVCAHSYYMESIPAWSNPTLYLYYYSSEFILGATGAWAVAAATKQDAPVLSKLALLTLIAAVVAAVVAIICAVYYSTISFHDVGIAFHTTDPTAPAAVAAAEETVSSLLAGENAPLFWGGVIVVGALVPAVAGLLKMRKPEGAVGWAIVAVICALLGGIAFRILLYVVALTGYVYF